MKFHDTFWRHVKSLDTFCKRFWDLDAIPIRHRVADKTTGHKTRQSVEEKISVKNLERTKPKHSEQETGSHGSEGWWAGWVCLIYEVTLEVSWFDLLSLIEAR